MGIINKKALNFKAQFKQFEKLQVLVLCALFIALYAVLYFFNIKITSDIQFRPGYLAIAAAALYGGPIMGMVVGATGDVISMLITGGQGEVFFFGFTLSYALMGFFFGIVLYGGAITVARGIAAAIVEFLVSLFLNTYWLLIMYYGGQDYFSLLILRIPKCLIMFVISSVVLTILMKALHQALLKSHLIK